MCEIYRSTCKLCDEEIEMHLADFSTGRDEVEVFCEKHIPENTTRGVVWEWTDSGAWKPRNWKRMFVKSLTDNARARAEGNHPNAWHTRIVTQ